MKKNKSIKDVYAQPWKKFAQTWQLFYPPHRPSKKNIIIYEKLLHEVIGKKKNIKVLILGATPELRDMLTRYSQIEVTVSDINIDMIIAMTSLMKRKPKNEILVKADWGELPLKESYYDVVFADLITGNLPREKLSLVYEKVNFLLKNNGYFIQRMGTVTVNDKPYSFTKAVKKYSCKPLNYQTLSHFWAIAFFLCMVNLSNKINTNDFFHQLKEYTKDPRVKKLYDLVIRTLPANKTWSYGYTWDEDKKLFDKYFTIEKRITDPWKPYQEITPTYKLKVKK